MAKVKIKKLVSNEFKNDSNIALGESESLCDFFDCVVMNNKGFAKLSKSNVRFKELENKPKKRLILKIMNKKRSIYRIYRGRNLIGLNDDTLALPSLTFYELFPDEDNKNDVNCVEVQRGNKLMFFLNHPNIQIRAVYILTLCLGLVSIILSAISILIAII